MAELDRFTTRYVFETDRRGAREAQKTIDNIRQSLNQISKQFLIFGTALTAGLGKIGHHTYKFSGEMNRLRRDTRATESQFKALREQAIKLGSSVDYTTITISDAVRAQRELVKGGLSIKQAMKALPNVLNFVAATEIDVGNSALYTTKIMKGFKLEVKDIPMIHDSIAHAATSMGITHDQLSNTLMRVSATANAAGINLKDMTSMLSVMVDEGMIAERSATSLERVISVLARAEVLDPKAGDALKSMGFSVQAVANSIEKGEVLPLFKQLKEAGLGVSEAADIFGEDGARAALKLANSVGNLRAFRDTMNDIDGVMRKQADTMNDNLFGAINALISAWDAFQITLGQAGIAQTLKKVTIRITELVGFATNMDDKWKKLISTILLSGPVLLGTGLALRVVSISLTGLLPLVRGLSVGFGALAVMGAILASPFKLLLLAFSPLGLMFLGAAAAGLVLMANWDKVKAKAVDVKDAILGIFGKGVGGGGDYHGETHGFMRQDIAPHGSGFTDMFATYFNNLKFSFNTAYNDFKGFIKGLLPEGGLINWVMGLFGGGRDYHGETHGFMRRDMGEDTGIGTYFDKLKFNLITKYNAFKEFVKNLLPAGGLVNWVKGLFGGGGDYHGETHGFMRQEISTGDEGFRSYFNSVTFRLKTSFREFKTFVKNLLPRGGLINWVKNLFGGGTDYHGETHGFMRQDIGTGDEGFGHYFNNVGQKLKTAFNNFKVFIKGLLPAGGVINWVKSLFGSGSDPHPETHGFMRGQISTGDEGFVSYFNNLKNRLKTAYNDFKAYVKGLLPEEGLVNWVKGLFKKDNQYHGDTHGFMRQDIAPHSDTLSGKIDNYLNNLIFSAKTKYNSFKNSLKNILPEEGIINWIKGLFSGSTEHHPEAHGFMRPDISTGNEGFSSYFNAIKISLKTAYNHFKTFVKGLLPAEGLINWVKGWFGGGTKHHGETHGFMRGQISSGEDGFDAYFNNLRFKLKTSYNNFKAFIKDLLPEEGLINWVKSFFGGQDVNPLLRTDTGHHPGTGPSGFGDHFNMLKYDLKTRFNSFKAFVTGFLPEEGLVNWVKGLFGGTTEYHPESHGFMRPDISTGDAWIGTYFRTMQTNLQTGVNGLKTFAMNLLPEGGIEGLLNKLLWPAKTLRNKLSDWIEG